MKYESQTRTQKLKKDGNKYVVISDEVERKTGFARGSVMSVVINNLKVIKAKQPNVRVAIKNTTEDLDFYSLILRKLPYVYVVFDKDCADRYSKNTIDEWLEFTNAHNSI